MAALKKNQRNCKFINRTEVERHQLGQKIRRRKLVAFPNAANFLVAVIRRKLRKRAIGGVVAPIRHHTAVISNPLPLNVNILNRNDPPWSGVRRDRLKLAHRLSITCASRRIHREGPPSALALGSIDQLANTY